MGARELAQRLYRAVFAGRRSFANLDLRGSDFSARDLRASNFSGADLTRANLQGANLRRCNFARANLSDASLRFADLYAANLRGASLSGADLSGADLRRASLKGARASTSTRWPELFSVPSGVVSEPFIARARVGAGGLRYAAQRLGLLLVFACVLFASAGTLDWPRAWGYLLAVLLLESLTLLLLALRAPETLNQRGGFGSGVKSFDRVFALLWLLLSLVTPVVAGLDAVRFRWSTLPWAFFCGGLAVLVLASAFASWAMLENSYFEQFVRIQEERGQRVVSSGPYRFVRHPGYLAAILGALATPLMLGSAWTFVPAGLVALLFAVRTHLEDETLRRELQGYEQYARRTRFRLLPGVW